MANSLKFGTCNTCTHHTESLGLLIAKHLDQLEIGNNYQIIFITFFLPSVRFCCAFY